MTLVEIIIVIAIMAVLSGTGMGLMGLISNANTKKCAQTIYSDLGRVKTNTLAKESGGTPPGSANYFKIYKDAKGFTMVEEGVNGHAETIRAGHNNVKVQYTTATIDDVDAARTCSSWSDIPTGAGSALNVEFNRSSGAVAAGCYGFSAIKVSNTKRTYYIILHEHTGKMEYKAG